MLLLRTEILATTLIISIVEQKCCAKTYQRVGALKLW